MQQVYQFFRLIRFSNILVIVLTMCFFYALLSGYHLARIYFMLPLSETHPLFNVSFFEKIGFSNIQFVLLITSVVLISAAGNIINDYFDVKADRVNKPKRLIIGKYIKRRWAIILNWSFNSIGLLIAIIISYQLNNWWIALISFLSINLLYFYSAIYKRKFLSGNIIVAFLTAIVPFYVFVFGAYSDFGDTFTFHLNDAVFISDNILTVLGYCYFAFFLNLAREIIKDMADVKGDLLLKSKTLPIRFGFKTTKMILLGVYMIVLTPLSYYIFIYNSQSINSKTPFLGLIAMVVITLLISIIVLLYKNRRKTYLLASNLLKVAMLFGILSTLFYY